MTDTPEFDIHAAGNELIIATADLPPIPAKRYFTIGEVSELCGVKPHVLRYWEQEFTQLKPIKRRGNRRYYQHHEVLLVRRIRELLYEHGYTISGARNQLGELPAGKGERPVAGKPLTKPRGKQATAISAQDGEANTVEESLPDVLTASAVRAELVKVLAVLRG
jgi:DNA-binding transcriptional MerR regulator